MAKKMEDKDVFPGEKLAVIEVLGPTSWTGTFDPLSLGEPILTSRTGALMWQRRPRTSSSPWRGWMSWRR